MCSGSCENVGVGVAFIHQVKLGGKKEGKKGKPKKKNKIYSSLQFSSGSARVHWKVPWHIFSIGFRSKFWLSHSNKWMRFDFLRQRLST